MASKKTEAVKKPVNVKASAKAAPAKAAKPAGKPTKATAPVSSKKAPQPVVTKAAAKKNEPMKKTSDNNSKVDTKSAAKAAPEKKAVKAVAEPEKKAPAKKAVAAPVPEKKAAAPVKKVAPAKAEKPAPVAAPKPEPKPEPKEPTKKAPKVPVKKVLQASSLDKRVLAAKAASQVVTARPMATPAARPTEKKPNVIIAHRKLENKSKHGQVQEEAPAYQTEVYRSLLDEPAPPPVTVYRYSDEDLVEFRELISNRLEAARKELIYLQGVITRKDEGGTEDTENRHMNIEDGSGAMEREQLVQLASRQIQFVNHLEKALIRIENKTYGICRVTGKLIEKARLRAVPHATLSIEAKKMMNTKQN